MRWNRHATTAAWGYLFILPQLIGLVMFGLFPLGWALSLSFMDWDGISAARWAGAANYVEQLQSSDLRLALLNTAYFTILTVPGGITLALLVALGVDKVRGKVVYRVLYFAPVVTSSVSVAIVWTLLFNNGDFGLVNASLKQWLGVQGPDWLIDARFLMPAMALLSIWWGLGYNMVIFLAGLQHIPRSYVDAARIDGANRLQVVRHVTLPLLSPTILFVTIMSIISSAQVFDLAYIMTGGEPREGGYTMVYHLYRLGFVEFTFGKSASAAMILFSIILLLSLAQMRLQRRWVHYGS